MDDHLRVVDQLGKKLAILDRVEEVLHSVVTLQMADVFHAAGGEVVQQHNVIASFEQTLREVGADKTGPAGDQKAQRASSKSLRIVFVFRRSAARNRILLRGGREFARLRFAISIGVRIAAVRIIVVWRGGIHCIEDDAD